jgi:hypothetical protein
MKYQGNNRISKKSEAFVTVRRCRAPGLQGCAKQQHINEYVPQDTHHGLVILWRMCHVHFDAQGSSYKQWSLVWKEKWNAIAKVAGTAIYLAPCGSSA